MDAPIKTQDALTKSPMAVARQAMRLARQSLPLYRHRFSPKIYTQHQLFVCLVLKTFFKTDYRGIVAIIRDFDALRSFLDLTRIPHFTTLQKASRRLLQVPWTTISSASVKKALLLSGTDRLRFVPNEGFLGQVSLRALAWDGTGKHGTTPNLAGPGKTGPGTALSSQIATAQLLVNTAPQLNT